MNNDSEKTDNTMNNDSEKGNKTWKQVVARFLLPLAILVSFLIPVLILIQMFGIWNPEQLKFLIFKDNQIIVIITLLASVSLLSFLLQIYMNKDPEKVAKIWKIVAYPVHWAYRLVVRLLLLVIRSAISILILILLAIITIASKVFESAISKVFESAISKVSEPKAFESLLDILSLYRLDIIISTIFIVLIAIVLVPHLFKRHAEDIGESLSKTKRRLCKVLRGRWWPGLDIKESLSVTWQNYGAKICPSLQKICAEFNKLIFAMAILGIGLVIYAAIVNTPPEKGTIFNLQSIFNLRSILVYIEPDHPHTDIEKKIANHPHPDIEKKIANLSHKLSISYLFEKGTQFSLAYASQGNLSTKTGICPEGSHEEWLELFKKAIWECSEEERMKLKVQGFASIAPVTEKGQSELDSTKSNTYNYQIANQRAEALIHYLMLPPDSIYTEKKCKDVLDNSSIWERKRENGTSVKPDSLWWKNSWGVTVRTDTVRTDTVRTDTVRTEKEDNKSKPLRFTFSVPDSATGEQKQKGFDVIYEPWQNYEDMNAKKPVYDGSQPKPRHYSLEFLNRTVQIIIEEGGCLRKEEDNAGKSD